MKKPLLALSCLSFCALMNAQTTIYSDDFDSYTSGMGVSEQSEDWTTWDGSGSYDGEVSEDYAFSGANSAKIEGTNTDLVLPIGPYTSGKYDLKMKMLVTNSGGYFNLMHIWSEDVAVYEWACDIFIDGNGTITWTTGFQMGGDYTVNVGEWFDIQVTADLDNEIGKIYINGEVVNEWTWSVNNADGSAGTNALVAADFYGTNTANGAGLFYIDDVQVIESTGVYTEEFLADALVNVYPNPATDMVQLNVPAAMQNASLSIYDMEGRLLVNQRLVPGVNTISVADLVSGIYTLSIENSERKTTEKLLVQ